MGREHKSNGVRLEVELLPRVIYQACWDPDCRGYASAATPIPPEALTEQEARNLCGLPPLPPTPCSPSPSPSSHQRGTAAAGSTEADASAATRDAIAYYANLRAAAGGGGGVMTQRAVHDDPSGGTSGGPTPCIANHRQFLVNPEFRL
jgi:hypothetical protein